jgi:hypothetical protein
VEVHSISVIESAKQGILLVRIVSLNERSLGQTHLSTVYSSSAPDSGLISRKPRNSMQLGSVSLIPLASGSASPRTWFECTLASVLFLCLNAVGTVGDLTLSICPAWD